MVVAGRNVCEAVREPWLEGARWHTEVAGGVGEPKHDCAHFGSGLVREDISEDEKPVLGMCRFAPCRRVHGSVGVQ